MPIIDKGKTIISRNPEITAYEIAVANGFVGTEAQWLESLIATPTYKVYTALLSQLGTNAPTATVLENTLGGEIIWERSSAGNYLGSISGDIFFEQDKSTFSIDNIFVNTEAYISRVFNGQQIQIYTVTRVPNPSEPGSVNIDEVASDSVLSRTKIEIRLYP